MDAKGYACRIGAERLGYVTYTRILDWKGKGWVVCYIPWLLTMSLLYCGVVGNRVVKDQREEPRSAWKVILPQE